MSCRRTHDTLISSNLRGTLEGRSFLFCPTCDIGLRFNHGVSCGIFFSEALSRKKIELAFSPMHPIQALSPLIACALIWVGSRGSYTVLAGLVAVGVYPYIAVGSVEKENGDADWPKFRHAIPEWGQFWHRSCGRIYETEGPGSKNFVRASFFWFIRVSCILYLISSVWGRPLKSRLFILSLKGTSFITPFRIVDTTVLYISNCSRFSFVSPSLQQKLLCCCYAVLCCSVGVPA